MRALSLITGAAVGAALMYAFDPQTGRRRRQQAFDAARGAIGSAGGAASGAYHYAGDAVGGGARLCRRPSRSHAQAAADALPSTEDASEAGQQILDSASNAAASYRQAARQRAQAWLDSARSMISRRRRPADVSAQISGSSAGALVLGALAAGMGAMWLFDPSRGRGRRAWIVQKGNRVVHETGHFMRSTGTHLRNKAKGYYHEAGSMVSDTDLAHNARAALDRLGEYASSIRIAAEHGYIRLTGRAPTDIVDDVLRAIRNLKGVLGVENELEVTDLHSPGRSDASHLSA